MNATELYLADGRHTGVYYCEQCKVTHHTKEFAEVCCNPAKCVCGADCSQYRTKCNACIDLELKEKEKARFVAAEKVTDWNGPVFDESTDEYYSSVCDFIEQNDDYECKYLWTCFSTPVCSLDYDTIIENATDEAYEDFEPGCLDGDEELKAALEKFNEINKSHVSWFPNYKLAVLLPVREVVQDD